MLKASVIKYFRWILGGVLLIAGILKLIMPDNLIEVLLFFDLLNEENAYVFVYMASILEIFLAISLFFQFKPRFTAISASVLCTIFLLISLVGYFNNWEIVCGCLGEFTFGNFDELMVIRNAVLLGMAAFICGSVFKTKETPEGVNKNNNKWR
ncbi:MauE/DoxX family redox-associated membrane protein [Gracilimonas halophila]|uniref:MauE/DoxX family redox-associated membrane protein n=1 Tax=Gracilimonas halophila TaxID=1834464 RepID=A0ABW5JK10_9BACT